MYYKSNSITGSNNTVPNGLSRAVCTTRATQLQVVITVPNGLSRAVCTTRATQLQVVITQFQMVCQKMYVLQEQLNYR